jgi:hypothetical protein
MMQMQMRWKQSLTLVKTQLCKNRDADYAAAKEKCDVLASAAKDKCMTQLKLNLVYSQSALKKQPTING